MTEDENIMVSVCMITYNHENYISQAIEGVLMQKSAFPVELIIGEDYSTDNTKKICLEYKEKYPEKIKLLLPETNFGMMQNFIKTLNACTGKYIALCEGDDYWTDPYKLQKQVDFLESNPDYIICFTNVETVKDDQIVIKENIKKRTQTVFNYIDMPIYAPTLTIMFRNIHLKEMPNINVYGGDTFLMIYLSQYGKTKFINDVTGCYRVHDTGVWSNLNQIEKLKRMFYTRKECIRIAKEPLVSKLYLQLFNFLSQIKKIDKSHNVYNEIAKEFRAISKTYPIPVHLVIITKIISPFPFNLKSHLYYFFYNLFMKFH